MPRTFNEMQVTLDAQMRLVTLQVTDHGLPRLSSTAYLNIVVNKTNTVPLQPTERYDKVNSIV
jgi:hypothetical protein